MSRIRTIKPEFFLDDELAELSPLNRLLFIGLWTLADCEGRLEDRPKRIRAQIHPYDDGDTDAMLQALHDGGFITRYTVGGARYIQIRSFKKHQRLSGKEAESDSVIPPPQDQSQPQSTVQPQPQPLHPAFEITPGSDGEAMGKRWGNDGETMGKRWGNGQCPGREGKGKEAEREIHAPAPTMEPLKSAIENHELTEQMRMVQQGSNGEAMGKQWGSNGEAANVQEGKGKERKGRGREEEGKGREGERSEEPRARKPPISPISPDWMPGQAALDILAQQGIPELFALGCIPEFRLYWSERGDARPGWDACFVNSVRRTWEKRPMPHASPRSKAEQIHAQSQAAIAQWLSQQPAALEGDAHVAH